MTRVSASRRPAPSPDRQEQLGWLAHAAARAAGATRTGAQETTGALQTLPDATLLGLAAGWVGVGAGFYLARKPRWVVAAGVVPALVMAGAVLLRPISHAVPRAEPR